MEITLFRDHESTRESRQLPAETYNMARIMLGKSSGGHVFVPVRSIQYLAIIDEEEIVFVDSAYKNQVAIAWTDFHPQQRSSLQEAVPYTVRCYLPDNFRIMRRLQAEFLSALRALNGKQPRSPIARIIKLPGKRD
ncbi:MAG: hypothetical protein GC139_02780 [Sideroxydans sp.]|nr:hypothetical protein [Sideroxydans sp.]